MHFNAKSCKYLTVGSRS